MFVKASIVGAALLGSLMRGAGADAAADIAALTYLILATTTFHRTSSLVGNKRHGVRGSRAQVSGTFSDDLPQRSLSGDHVS